MVGGTLVVSSAHMEAEIEKKIEERVDIEKPLNTHESKRLIKICML